MRKIFVLLLLIVASSALVFANGQGEGAGPALEDGFYFAQEAGFGETGWKYVVSIVVEDGKIASAEWNGANAASGPDKITLSEEGGYPMVARGGAQSEWHVQSALVEEYLLEVQDPTRITYSNEDGTTDAISGVSIHINEFVELATEALSEGPVGRGPYKDGWYFAEEPEFSHGYKERVDLTVIGGYIVAAHWNPQPEEGEKDKYVASQDGEYGMVENGGAQAAWFEQADKVEAALLETQDPAEIPTDDEGNTDAISGVSITVSHFLELAEEALADAR